MNECSDHVYWTHFRTQTSRALISRGLASYGIAVLFKLLSAESVKRVIYLSSYSYDLLEFGIFGSIEIHPDLLLNIPFKQNKSYSI